MPTCTAIILRQANAKPIRVLEVDGPSYPRRTHPVQRGEGSYYLRTSNHPPCHDSWWLRVDDAPDLSRFKDWGDPCWELYQMLDGTVVIHSCRPSKRETIAGDLHGRWGSVIVLSSPTREAIRNGLRLARRLCLCSKRGVVINRRHLGGIAKIESNIPIRW
jgi:hypothetical protein